MTASTKTTTGAQKFFEMSIGRIWGFYEKFNPASRAASTAPDRVVEVERAAVVIIQAARKWTRKFLQVVETYQSFRLSTRKICATFFERWTRGRNRLCKIPSKLSVYKTKNLN